MSETSGTEKNMVMLSDHVVINHSVQSVGEPTATKREQDRQSAHQHTMLTGDTLNRSAAILSKLRQTAIAAGLENPARVRGVRSSPRGVITLTWRRDAVIVY